MKEIKMKKVTVEIPEGKKLVLKDGAYIVVEDKPEDVRDRIKTFEDAYKELDGRDDELHYLIAEYDNSWACCKELLAYLKLRIIVAALNEGWEPEFKEGENRYYILGKLKNDCVILSGVYYDPLGICMYHGYRLAFKSKELAEYAGEQFKDLWIDYLTK